MLLSFRPDLLGLFAVGASSALLGLLIFLLAPARRGAGWGRPLALAGGLALMGLGGAWGGLPQEGWLPLLALAGAWALFALGRSSLADMLTGGALKLVRQPRGQGALLFLAGGALLAWQAANLARDEAPELEIGRLVAEAQGPRLSAIPGAQAITDAGAVVPLFTSRGDGPETENEGGTTYIHSHGLDERVILTGDANPNYNCHGWTFTAGRFWVRGEAVEQILKDNGYSPVSGAPGGRRGRLPQPGRPGQPHGRGPGRAGRWAGPDREQVGPWCPLPCTRRPTTSTSTAPVRTTAPSAAGTCSAACRTTAPAPPRPPALP